MIYGSSVSSSSSCQVGLPPAAEERRPLLYENESFRGPKEPPQAESGTLNTPNIQPIPLERHYERQGKMEKFFVILKKLETEHEPGLSNAQLMLINHDLKPVEPARRTWGSWNFVGFWIADSFNIVGLRSLNFLEKWVNEAI
ncbi:hypothetical protein BDZ91DRAFT_723959 [Kalaharituber pfeilii]|nr:hypothetical protein BDZ91DRAFT_723959 [Kalaharituber pfeilii]